MLITRMRRIQESMDTPGAEVPSLVELSGRAAAAV